MEYKSSAELVAVPTGACGTRPEAVLFPPLTRTLSVSFSFSRTIPTEFDGLLAFFGRG